MRKYIEVRVDVEDLNVKQKVKVKSGEKQND
jgi:hypothetical protein